MYTLKKLAEAGYVMGLATIDEVANHMRLHYDAYFSIKHFNSELHDFEFMVEGHEDDSIFKYLTEEDKKQMDDELEKLMEQGAGDEEETRGEEAKVEEGEALEGRDAHDGSGHEGAP